MATEYAFAPGWNTPLNQLNNVENHLGSRNRIALGRELIPVTIRSSVIDPFPARTNDQAGGEVGDGFLNQDWVLSLALYGYKFLLDTYFASETVTEQAWTIYTRRHVLASFQRYNVWTILPSVANGDITLPRDNQFNGVFQVRLRHRDLILSS